MVDIVSRDRLACRRRSFLTGIRCHAGGRCVIVDGSLRAPTTCRHKSLIRWQIAHATTLLCFTVRAALAIAGTGRCI